jgi:hypothetical protein
MKGRENEKVVRKQMMKREGIGTEQSRGSQTDIDFALRGDTVVVLGEVNEQRLVVQLDEFFRLNRGEGSDRQDRREERRSKRCEGVNIHTEKQSEGNTEDRP